MAPGRVIKRAEREQRTSEEERWRNMSPQERTRETARAEVSVRQLNRKDSSFSFLDGQQDERAVEKKQREYDYSFQALGQKLLVLPQAWPWLDRLGNDINYHFAPGACATAATQIQGNGRPFPLRSLLVVFMMVLIVFGALYSVVEYLLLVTRASACDVSTVFLPVTYTVTRMVASPSSTILKSPEDANATLMTTTQSTSTLTPTLTSFESAEPTSTLPYVYTIDSAGNTDWINGVSPSPGVSLVTATTTVTVDPPQTTAVDSTQSDPTDVTYLTGPTYTSTLYSFDTPDTTLTSTSTSTRYVTSTLEHVSPASAINDGRPCFSGIASGGWNITTTWTAAGSPAALSSMQPESMTLTSVYFTPIESGESTTTTTIHTTTTIALRYTTTVLPASSASNGEDPAMTNAPLPATMSSSESVLTDPLVGPSMSMASLSTFSSTANGTLVDAITGTMASSGPHSSSTSLPLDYSPPSRFSAAGVSTTGLPSSFPLSMASLLSNSTGGSLVTVAKGSNRRTPQPSSTLPPKVSSGSTGSADGRLGITRTLSSAASESEHTTLYPQPIMSKGTSMVWNNSSAPHIGSMASPEAASTGSASQMPASVASSASHSSHTIGTESTGVTSFQKSSTSTDATSSGTVLSHSATTTAFATMLSSSIKLIRTSPQSAAGNHANSMPGSDLPSPYSTATSSISSLTLGALSSIASSRGPGTSTAQTPSSTISFASSVLPTTVPSGKSESLSASSPPASKPAGTAGALSSSKSSPQTTLTMRPKSSGGFNATSTIVSPASSATATPSGGCGEHGDFMVDFDDLPNFFPTENDTAITQAPPVLNPYHHLTFDDGYVYAPAPAESYPPVSSPHLAVFLGNASGVTTRRRSENEPKPGEIGDGPRDSISAFWFDAYSAWFGCDNPGPDTCTLVFKALSWSAATKKEELTFQQNSTIPPCRHRFEGCHLQKVDFPTSFRGLTGIQIQAFVRDEEKMFFMDDLALKWSNNTCAAGLLRQSSR